MSHARESKLDIARELYDEASADVKEFVRPEGDEGIWWEDRLALKL